MKKGLIHRLKSPLAIGGTLLAFQAVGQTLPIPHELSAFKVEPEAYSGYLEERNEVRSQRILQGHRSNEAVSSVPSAPWVLSGDQHPGALSHSPFLVGGKLILNVPKVSEVKLMLPGQISGFIDRARSRVSRHFQDRLGAGIQERRLQLADTSAWVEGVLKKYPTIPEYDWPQYQFAMEARGAAEKHKRLVQSQSNDQLDFSLENAQSMITKLNALMPHIPSENAQQALYGVMVDIRDGMEALKDGLERRDAEVIRELDRVLARVAAVPRPVFDPPTRDESPAGGGWVERRTYEYDPGRNDKPRRVQYAELAALEEGIAPPEWTGPAIVEEVKEEVRDYSDSRSAAVPESTSSGIPGFGVVMLLLALFGAVKYLKIPLKFRLPGRGPKR